MMNGEWFSEVLCPNRLRNVGKGRQPSVNLMLSQKKEVELETTILPLLIFKSVVTWIALMIYGLAVTQVSSMISISTVEYVS